MDPIDRKWDKNAYFTNIFHLCNILLNKKVKGDDHTDPGYCRHCKKNMNGKMDINWVIFVILFLLFILGAIIYLIYCLTKPSICAYCGSVLEPYRSERSTQMFACTKCGAILDRRVAFCPDCGNPMPSHSNGADSMQEYNRTNPDKVTIIGPDEESDGRWVDYFDVTIDGKKVMEGINGGTREIDLYSGEHSIEATIRWRYSIGGSRGEMKHGNATGYLGPGSVLTIELVDNRVLINIS